MPLSDGGADADSNLTELAARFITKSGGGLSPRLSADLALEIVLNEIVEQACLATGATGAAIVLRTESGMVCRASSGETAPPLGVRFEEASGLSHLCMETGQVQRCDDAQTDERADAEVCRRMGVHSVMVLPLRKDEEVVGLFEIFSSRPMAFGDRDEHTLEALARRVLKNLELAGEPLPEAVLADSAAAVFESGDELHSFLTPISEPSLVPENQLDETPSGQTFDFVTGALGAGVLAGALLLAVLIGQRLNLTGTGHVARSAPEDARSASTGVPNAPKAAVRANTTSTIPAAGGEHPASASIGKRIAGGSSVSEARLPEGSLRVYENGKEIFRMPPTVGESPVSVGEGGVRKASAIEPAQVMELSPAAAEGSLVHRVEPEYPEEARQQQIQGLVVLDVRIRRDGDVQSVNLVSGQRLLADAAIAAVKQWRFNPRRVHGQPVEMQTTVTLNFRLPLQPKM
jgi:TonB family protein